jgi:5'-nucleotidase
MKNRKLQVLITNDDGVFSPGLLALAQALKPTTSIRILAPARNWSATGHTRTLDKPLHAQEVTLQDGTPAWACDGSPADCVALALKGFFDENIDMVISGINTTANVGDDVTYSGTIAAAIEATIWGVPAIAVSLDKPETYQHADYGPAARFVSLAVQNVSQHGMARGTLLNVNVPSLREQEIRGVQVTRQGTRIYNDVLEKRTDPRGKPYYWVIGSCPTGITEPGTDITALADGFISVTPLKIDLTDFGAINELTNWTWEEAIQYSDEVFRADLLNIPTGK